MNQTPLEAKQYELLKHQLDNALTKRDNFAITTLTELLSSRANQGLSESELVNKAYRIADLMLKQSKTSDSGAVAQNS